MARPPRSAVDAQSIRRLKLGFVLLVGLSATTMALQGGASVATALLATLVGFVAGGALLWYLTWVTR